MKRPLIFGVPLPGLLLVVVGASCGDDWIAGTALVQHEADSAVPAGDELPGDELPGDDELSGDQNPPADQDEPAELEGDIATLLRSLTPMAVEEIDTSLAGYRHFNLRLEQPEDHFSNTGVGFSQLIELHHSDLDAPMVLYFTGYDNYFDEEYISEPAEILQANQIIVEHRFFGESIASSPDWSRLTVEQSAHDSHRVVEALKAIYRGKWIATGASKGGMTAVFHRRFFPDDVDGVVAYVAPLSLGAPDERYASFLDAVDEDGCNERVRQVQQEMIKRRSTIAPTVQWTLEQMGVTTTTDEAASLAVDVAVGHQWGFWQYQGVAYCSAVPGQSASDAYLAREVATWGAWFADTGDSMWPYYYQAMAELGFQSYPEAHLEQLLSGISSPSQEQESPPWDTDPTYDAGTMRDVAAWLSTDSERIMLIYGELDPWTGGAMELGNSQDSFRFDVPKGNHGAVIAQLSQADADLAKATLARWADRSVVRRVGLSRASHAYEWPPDRNRRFHEIFRTVRKVGTRDP